MPARLPKPRLPLVLGFFFLLGLSSGLAAPHPIYFQDTDRFESTPDLLEHDLETFIKRQQAWAAGKGVHTFASFWGDFLANPIGGESQGSAWTQLLIAGAEIDLHRTIGWPPDGAILVSMTDGAGSNLSTDIGNVFAVPQAYLLNTGALFDLYYKQELFDGRVMFDVGRMSAGQFFATLPAMTMVVSAAVNGNPSSLFINALFPAATNASWGAHLKLKPAEQIYAEAGVFQASPRNGMLAYHGADFSIRRGDGVLLMAEMGWTPDFVVGKKSAPADGKMLKTDPPSLPGVYNFGAYLTNYAYDRFRGGVERNTYGFYGLAQQMMWRSRANPMHSFSLWGGVTYSPQEQIALLPAMGMGGMIFQGFVPTRDADSALLSFYSGRFSRSYGDALVATGAARPTVETVIEASYIIQITPSLQLQPDLQYIFRPGGDGTIPDALVLGGQVSVMF